MNEDESIRIGDRERNDAADRLGEHMAEGRITREEYEMRLDTILGARTNAELAVPFRDLPVPRQAAPTPARPAPGPDIWERLAQVSSALALLAFFVAGFALDGWAWAWVFFLLPGVFAGLSRRGSTC